MERAFGIHQPGAAGMSSGKLDGCLYAFTARAAEECLFHFPTSQPAKPVREPPGEFGNVALQHRRPAPVEFALQSLDNARMVMAGVVDAIAGQKVQNAAPIRGEQRRTGAAVVRRVHAQNVEEANPLRIYVQAIKLVNGRRGEGFTHRVCLSTYSDVYGTPSMPNKFLLSGCNPLCLSVVESL